MTPRRVPQDGSIDRTAGVGTRLLLIDESVIATTSPDLTYIVAAAVLLRVEATAARAAARDAIRLGADRTRPFHWMTEGSSIKTALCEALVKNCERIDLAVVAPTPARRQEAARAVALAAVLNRFHQDGLELGEILIESRDGSAKNRGQNKFDHQTIIEARRRGVLHPKTPYGWAGKDEPLLWFPDAAAGAMSEALRGKSGHLSLIEREIAVIRHEMSPP